MWRLALEHSNTNFLEMDVCNENEFEDIMRKFNFTHIVNLAEGNHEYAKRDRIGYLDGTCTRHVIDTITRFSHGRDTPVAYLYLNFAGTSKSTEMRQYRYGNSKYVRFVEIIVGHIQGAWDRPDLVASYDDRKKDGGRTNPFPKVDVAYVVKAISKIFTYQVGEIPGVLRVGGDRNFSFRGNSVMPQKKIDLLWNQNAPPTALPCASECSSTPFCLPTAFDEVVLLSKSSTRNCDAVYYTVGFHRMQTSLKEIKSPQIATECCLAFIASDSPLSKRENDTYHGWTLMRLSLSSMEKSNFSASARKMSRLPKINPSRFFSAQVRYAVYFDSSSTPTLNPRDIRASMTSGDETKRASMVMFHHPTLMYYGGSAIRSAMQEAEAAKSRSGTPEILLQQGIAYGKVSHGNFYRNKLSYNVMPTALFIIWDLRSKAAHEFRCRWYDEYSLWGDRDQVSLFFTIAMIMSRQQIKTDVFQEWIPLGPSQHDPKVSQNKSRGRHEQRPHLRLLLGKNENYKPFFIKGEDDEKGYPKDMMNSG